MRSKWVFISVLVLAVLSIGGSCRVPQQETAVFASDHTSDQVLGSISPAAKASPAHVAGSWSLLLIDSASGRTQSVYIEMSQIDDVIFGRGSTGATDLSAPLAQTEPKPTKDEGIESMIWWLHQDTDSVSQTTTVRYLTIGASGRTMGNALSLDLIFLEENVLYKLDLNVVGSSITGRYLAYDSVGRVQSGTCYGSIRAGYGQLALPLGSKPDVVNLGGMRS